MKTRIVYTKFWDDNYILELGYKEKLLFIYLLTNDKVNICSIYELPDRHIKNVLKLSQKALNEMKEKFIRDKKFYFKDGWVRILNSDKYNVFSGEKNEACKEKELREIPEFMRYPIDRVSEKNDRVCIPLVISSSNQKSIISNKKSEIRNKYDYKTFEEANNEKFKAHLKSVYPEVNIELEFRKMELWLQENPNRRYSNYGRFAGNWVSRLAKESEKSLEGKPKVRKIAPPPGGYPKGDGPIED